MYNKIYLAFGLLAAYLIFKNTKKMSFIKPILGGRITSVFGYRKHPVTGLNDFHNGVDFAAPVGTAVLAPADGTVQSVFKTDTGGNQIVIKHTPTLSTGYAHLDTVLVSVGQKVKQGQKIATVGKTGAVTGPHLHFVVKQENKAVNPLEFIS